MLNVYFDATTMPEITTRVSPKSFLGVSRIDDSMSLIVEDDEIAAVGSIIGVGLISLKMSL